MKNFCDWLMDWGGIVGVVVLYLLFCLYIQLSKPAPAAKPDVSPALIKCPVCGSSMHVLGDGTVVLHEIRTPE
jgi:hypothetical protein